MQTNTAEILKPSETNLSHTKLSQTKTPTTKLSQTKTPAAKLPKTKLSKENLPTKELEYFTRLLKNGIYKELHSKQLLSKEQLCLLLEQGLETRTLDSPGKRR
ncbi:MAG: hypothetical protein K2P45_11860 [Eubacterium sp.]|nr:hypothetical protein [Eubacterium sp.]